MRTREEGKLLARAAVFITLGERSGYELANPALNISVMRKEMLRIVRRLISTSLPSG